MQQKQNQKQQMILQKIKNVRITVQIQTLFSNNKLKKKRKKERSFPL